MVSGAIMPQIPQIKQTPQIQQIPQIPQTLLIALTTLNTMVLMLLGIIIQTEHLKRKNLNYLPKNWLNSGQETQQTKPTAGLKLR